MDIYDYLKMDHDKVSNLFKQFEKSKLVERKQQIVALIAHELLIHAKSEQDTFYIILEQRLSNPDEVLHGRKEHAEIEAQIQLVTKQDTKPNGTWQKQVLKLKDLVEHHVKEEEGAIFKEAKKVVSDEEAITIKEKMHARKEQLAHNKKK